jgi:hypothetical protein
MMGYDMRMSAAVSEAPQRYSPLSGDEANCDSRKPKCVAKLSFRYRLSTLSAMPRVTGLMKKGTGESRMSVVVVSIHEVYALSLV